MASDEQWYVLVEANSAYGYESYWQLEKKHYVEGDRSAALARAEEICRTWGPSHFESEEETGRTVFQTSETSWLVEVTSEWWSKEYGWNTSKGHFRVTVARLVHAKETPPAQPPEKKPGVIRRAFGSGR